MSRSNRSSTGRRTPPATTTGDFHPPPDATLSDAFGAYWAEIEVADRIYAAASLDDIERRERSTYSVRWILVHLIEEYARHCGHADLIRNRSMGRLVTEPRSALRSGAATFLDMSVQVNVRLDNDIVEQLDGWTVIRGKGRPELIREAVSEWLSRREDERVGDAYRRAYGDVPETDEEMEQAEANARLAIAEEPWSKWW